MLKLIPLLKISFVLLVITLSLTFYIATQKMESTEQLLYDMLEWSQSQPESVRNDFMDYLSKCDSFYQLVFAEDCVKEHGSSAIAAAYLELNNQSK